MDTNRTQLIALYAEMAEMTKQQCDDCSCEQREAPYRCCQPWACELAMAYADWKWGVELRHTGHEFPLMGERGCTAQPHLRPACSKHLCENTAKEMTEGYWTLKEKISKLESLVFGGPS